MNQLKFSISGIRGPAPKMLSPELCVTAAKAFARFSRGGVVAVGTDTRQTRGLLKEAVISGLSSSGCTVLDAGIIPTPTLSHLIRELKADGGIMISASHNPEPDNGLKFMNGRGLFLNEKDVEALKSVFFAGDFIAGKPVAPKPVRSPFAPHISRIFENIAVPDIAKCSFKVALDSVNGAGSLITRRLLKDLGCTVVAVHTDPDAGFPRKVLEPLPDQLGDICDAIKRKRAAVGFVQDPDADRLAIVSEEGRPIGEEYTLALAVAHVLKNRRGKAGKDVVVTNLSTTQAIDDIAALHGAKVLRTKIGEINVTEGMIRSGSVIGGEGNGGVIFAPIGLGRDSLTAIALVLEYMAVTGRTLSELHAELPQYHMQKTKIECGSAEEQEARMASARKMAEGKRTDTTDGIKIFEDDSSWIHIRASNTEHAVRVIAESRSAERTSELIERFRAF